MTSNIILICCVISNIVAGSEAARILAVFPTPSISHQVVFRPLTQELAKRGHEVIVITTDPVFLKGQTPANFREIDVHEVSYTAWRRILQKTSTGRKNDMQTQMKLLLKQLSNIFEVQLQNEEVRKLLVDKSRSFDLLLVEACAKPALILAHVYKVPVIQISSFGAMFGDYETFGAPAHPLLYPLCVRQKLNNLSFWEKAIELYNHYSFKRMWYDQEVEDDKMLVKHFGTNIPALEQLRSNVDMLFLNIHPLWEGNFPAPPGIVYMGGMHQKPEKPLPGDLKRYLDSSKNGVIYISFGTNVMPSLLPKERIQILINVFSQLPYNVLWKWDTDDLPGISENINISKWLPQSDLLRHPKVKLFITQGGLQSTDEAITAGVPLIGMPMLGDQWYNVEKYVHHKIGMRLDMETLTEEEFKNAINTVIEDTSYRRNIVRLGELMRDQPQPPLDKTVWWTEYVIRHGGAKHLRSPAANISWWEYLEVEFVGTILIATLSSLVLCVGLITFIWKSISRKFISFSKKSKTN